MNPNKKIISVFRTNERKKKTLEVLKKRQLSLTLVLENIIDPHNISAVVRTCDAVGVFSVCLVYDGTQPFPKLGAKSSASARKWIYQRKFISIIDCYSELRSEGKKIYSTDIHSDSISLYDLDLTEPVALVFGNEHTGLSQDAVKLADKNFRIPQFGMIESLNISVAAGVTLYEALRQRLAKGMYEKPELREDELIMYYEEWLSK